MRKFLSIIILISVISFTFTGCKANEKSIDTTSETVLSSNTDNKVETGTQNSALKLLASSGEKINDSAIAVIINSPDESQLAQVSNLDNQVIEESGDKILILPTKSGTDIRIEKVKYENEKLIAESIVKENKNTADGYGLYLTATRAEGIPLYQIVISYKHTSTTYILAYNGKDGTPPIEWIIPGENNTGDLTTKPIDSSQTTMNYELTQKNYKIKNVNINYPQIINLGDDNKQKSLNEIIKNEALEGFTQGIDDNLTLEIKYNIQLQTSDYLSIQYYGLATTKGAAYPTNEFFTTNIDMKNGKKLKLADISKIDNNFVKSFKEGSYVATEPGNHEMEEAASQFISNITNEELIKYFNQADSRKFEENPSKTYSYLTKDSIVVSVEVPHAIGDHAEYKIERTSLK